MKKNIFVSVIINNYNYGRFLADAINSAINQIYPIVEVIVVDDGSTDLSTQIIAGYGDKIIPILKKNGGQGSAFNAGFKASKGDVIIFLDSDDTLFPTAIANAVEGFNSPAVAKVHWAMWRINASGEKTGGLVPQHTLIEGNLQDALILYGPDGCGGPPYSPPTSGNAWSRQFLKQVLPMPEIEFKSGADMYLFVLLPLFGELRRLSEPQGCYRVHGSNNTLKPIEKYITEFFSRYDHCCLTLIRHLKNKGIDVKPETWTRDSWYHRIYTAMQDISSVIPPDSNFILIDDDFWKTTDFLAGRCRMPFMERNGEYWGLPADDAEAIQEILRLEQLGASFIVFPWFCFWWLEYYRGFFDYLKTNYKNCFQNDLMLVYEL